MLSDKCHECGPAVLGCEALWVHKSTRLTTEVLNEQDPVRRPFGSRPIIVTDRSDPRAVRQLLAPTQDTHQTRHAAIVASSALPGVAVTPSAPCRDMCGRPCLQ